MRLRTTVLAVTLLVLLAPVDARAAQIDLTISNFRYCALPACGPADTAYVSDETGAPVVANVVNPAATVDVRRGDVVRWTYDDLVCDRITNCFHQVIARGGAFADLAINRNQRTFSWTVSGTVGQTILYYCLVGNGFHARSGMTGALRIVA